MWMKKTILIALFLCLAGSMTGFADETIVYENDYNDQTPVADFNEGAPWNWGTDICAHTVLYADYDGNIVVEHTGAIDNNFPDPCDARFGSMWSLEMTDNISPFPEDYIIEFDVNSVSGNWDPIALEFFVLTNSQGYGSGDANYTQIDGWVHVEMSLADLTVGWWNGTNWDLTNPTWQIEIGGPPWPGTSVPAGQAWDQIWVMDNLKITQISPPTKSYNPDPPNGATNVYVDAIFSWTPGFYADKHDIYLGTDFNDVSDANRDNPMGVLDAQDYIGNTYEPNNLQFNTTYYWRIDDVNDPNIYKGSVWSFTVAEEYLAEIIVYENDYEGETVGDGFTEGNAWNWGDNGTVHTATYQDYGGNIVVDHNGTIGNPTAEARNMRFGSKWDIAMTGNTRSDPADYTIEFDLRSVSGNWDPINLEFFVLTKEAPDQGYGSGASAYAQADGWVHVEKNLADLNVGWWEGTNWDMKNPSWSIEVGGPPWPGTSVPAGTPAWDQVWIMDNLKITVFMPPTSYEPYPENEAEDVKSNPVLRWTPGMYANKHDVYFGTDFNTVNEANRTNDPCGVLLNVSQEPNYYEPGILEFNKTYYWRIDDVNDPNIWKGSVWSFTTADFIFVDDFEDYNNNSPDRVFQTWVDGVGYSADQYLPGDPGNGTGSAVGHDIWSSDSPYYQGNIIETSIVHGRGQSMPMDYNNVNDPFISEAIRTWDTPQDWTAEGVAALTIWFRGYRQSVGGISYNAATQTYTMTGAGADIYELSDEFHYAYKQLSGEGSITAKVENLTDIHEWSKAGVMIRETLDADSAQVLISVTPQNGVEFMYRPLAGDTTTAWAEAGYNAPHWVRIRRVQNDFYAEHSTDGVIWVDVQGDSPSSTNIPMSVNTYIGLHLCSHEELQTAEAVFSNVRTTGDVTPTGPFTQSQDIGILSNDADKLYVIVEDDDDNSHLVEYPEPNATQIYEWQDFNIDMREFTNADVNTAAITKMTLGVGNKADPASAGTGSMYFDDIRLHWPRCVPSQLQPVGDINDDCVVDESDLEIMANEWLDTATEDVTLVADLDDDDDVDFGDYARLASAWLEEQLWPEL